MAIIECVPNFSEGANGVVLQEIANSIESVKGVKLLHQDSGIAANRTVFTFAGEIEGVFTAAFNAIAVAANRIDMRHQKGEHPRIGACDVCPFVPISGISLEELSRRVKDFAKRVNEELDIPIYLYEASATIPKRKNLANHRIGEYENIENRLASQSWLPDFGTSFNPISGGTVMGARNFLVAYNINLSTKDENIAQEIAYDLRELGRPIGKENGRTIYKAGRLKFVKAIGWYIKDFEKAQVSINLTNFNHTPIHEVFETTQSIAKKYGVDVTGSEMIGLVPKSALMVAGQHFLGNKEATEELLIQSSIKGLGLNELNPFSPNNRILEYVLEAE